MSLNNTVIRYCIMMNRILTIITAILLFKVIIMITQQNKITRATERKLENTIGFKYLDLSSSMQELLNNITSINNKVSTLNKDIKGLQYLHNILQSNITDVRKEIGGKSTL